MHLPLAQTPGLTHSESVTLIAKLRPAGQFLPPERRSSRLRAQPGTPGGPAGKHLTVRDGSASLSPGAAAGPTVAGATHPVPGDSLDRTTVVRVKLQSECVPYYRVPSDPTASDPGRAPAPSDARTRATVTVTPV
eukprot:768640-Hanusia_phi.AAC.2